MSYKEQDDDDDGKPFLLSIFIYDWLLFSYSDFISTTNNTKTNRNTKSNDLSTKSKSSTKQLPKKSDEKLVILCDIFFN